MSILKAQVPRKLAPLLRPARYKAAYGGRGGAKSHFYAEQIVLRCIRNATRVACIREVQNSLKESVKQLLVDKIQKFQVGHLFQVLDSEIRGPHGSLIIFRGMQAYNSETIKSLEGYDVAWVEEAQTLSEVSLRMLRPTIRKPGSEIWFSWNPRHDTDAVDVFCRGPNPPKDLAMVEINWDDNPWFPDVLRDEKDRDYEADPELADNVWGGGYELVSEGAYYAKLIAIAEKEGRLGYFPYDPERPVITSWDIGVDDYTAIWFWQIDADFRGATAIDYYETSGDGADDIMSTALPELFKPPPYEERFIGWSATTSLQEYGRETPYKYGRQHYLPHDIKVREWGSGARSRIETLKSYGLDGIRQGVAQGPAERIQAFRRILPHIRFHNSVQVQLGLKRLRRYRRKWSDTLQTYTKPEHDMNSHGSDAAGEFAINCRIKVPEPPREKPKTKPQYEANEDGSLRVNMTVKEIIEAKRRKRLANA